MFFAGCALSGPPPNPPSLPAHDVPLPVSGLTRPGVSPNATARGCQALMLCPWCGAGVMLPVLYYSMCPPPRRRALPVKSFPCCRNATVRPDGCLMATAQAARCCFLLCSRLLCRLLSPAPFALPPPLRCPELTRTPDHQGDCVNNCTLCWSKNRTSSYLHMVASLRL